MGLLLREERGYAKDHLVEHAPQRPNVSAQGAPGIEEQLRRHVHRRAQQEAVIYLIELLRKAEVCKDAAVPHQNVRGLYVSVH